MMPRHGLAIVALLVASLPARAADFTAKPRYVVDGDTVTINLRSKGIDAPESAQQCADRSGQCYPCGQRATAALQALLGTGEVTVRVWETDAYGRPVVSLYVGGKDVHHEMLRQGHAIAYRRYLPDALRADYLAAEAEAKAARRGIWSGAFAEPSRWRRGERLECERSASNRQ